MVVKRIEFAKYTLSIGTNYYPRKSAARKQFLDDLRLNIFNPKKGHPVIEDLMDKTVLNRSIPLDDAIETLYAIKDKYSYMGDYLEECIKQLKKYRSMI